jgi:hypothetical protein
VRAEAWFAAALVAACASCNRSSSDEALRTQRAIARLCWSENRVRNADNAEKARHLAELASTACPVPDACRMRDACVSAYTLHVDALNLTAAAKQLMSDGRHGEAAGILGAAEAKLKLAGPQIEQCTALSAGLRSSYSIEH